MAYDALMNLNSMLKFATFFLVLIAMAESIPATAQQATSARAKGNTAGNKKNAGTYLLAPDCDPSGTKVKTAASALHEDTRSGNYKTMIVQSEFEAEPRYVKLIPDSWSNSNESAQWHDWISNFFKQLQNQFEAARIPGKETFHVVILPGKQIALNPGRNVLPIGPDDKSVMSAKDTDYTAAMEMVFNKALAACPPLPITKAKFKEFGFDITLAADIINTRKNYQNLGIKLKEAGNFIYYLIGEECAVHDTSLTIESVEDDGSVVIGGKSRGMRVKLSLP